MAKTSIDFIPGMPPDQPIDDVIKGQTNTVMRNSMPIAKIYPGIPSFTEGTSLFKRKDFFSTTDEKSQLSYTKLLADHGFSLKSDIHNNCLTVAYLADSFPSDSFTNEYGENFLQGITDVASTAASSIAQMFGKRTATEALGSITDSLQGHELLSGAIDAAKSGGGKVKDILSSLPIVGGGVNAINAMVAGSRLDFPMIWKSSAFQPSYTMTIRLYNPNPGSQASTEKYIAGPLAAIMLLGMPISTDGNTFSWPFIHRISSPGIYDLDPAFISNITVIKGGDQQQIAYTQRLGIVDVRIDFGSLFNSLLVTKNTGKTRPTLKKYLDTISGKDSHKAGVKFMSSVGNNTLIQNEYKAKQNAALASNPAAAIQSQIPTLPSKGKSALNSIASLQNKTITALQNASNIITANMIKLKQKLYIII